MPSTPPIFRIEYEQEVETWLRRRFALLCAIFLGLECIGLITNMLATSRSAYVTLIALQAVSVAAIVGFFIAQRRMHGDRRQTLLLATAMILTLGVLSMAQQFFTVAVERQNLYGSLFLWHFVACLCLPWTPRESLRPMVPLLIAWTIVLVMTEPAARSLYGLLYVPLLVIAASLLFLPGLAISAWRLRRHGRQFHTRMIGKHFWSMRQEFQRARAIHESMFPQRRLAEDEPVRFDYAYAPMIEIGGDYLHLHVDDDGCRHLTLIDVTGHGLASALTVNRLFGELERIRAESPNAEPCEVLTLLNRYFYLTLQRHNIYATAIALTLDPNASEVRWCSAGHPPAFLRGANGVVRDLVATEALLGALSPDEFDAAQQVVQLAPGDVVIAYTDGAFEARDRAGEQFGMERLRRLIAGASHEAAGRDWPHLVADAVKQHTHGRAEDDVLVAALTFDPIRKAAQSRTGEAVVAGAG